MTLVTENLVAGAEPIPGYILRERIGAGGFGEVWSAEAPGGLEKAIKLVYGSLDSERASRELRSLERLRKVHHPFLLNLERFEVVNNRLLIVTERADEGLDTILERYQAQGQPGIPREEVLNYLLETSDALDHLRERYGLQHLDIKPANILVLSGHVKVADFGLVKDLRDADHSMVGGLTPTYAAPEVFDGRPSIHSDQYSLAIVFQELLTGQRPFNGRTIAQLATQHVHSVPNLESLPFVDRPVVARALEKNPERRFATCGEFIRRLRDASVRPRSLPASIERCGPAGDTAPGAPGITTRGRANVENLPAVAANNTLTAPVNFPLVIGLGGLGLDVLSQVQSELSERSPVQLRSLLIDTDAELLDAALSAQRASARLTPAQTLHLPLRTPHEYREFASGRLSSISRRWLYNVPRSGKTEGLRTIGRLALVDHCELLIGRLLNEVKALPTTEGAEVFVVASLSGGTGSGMVWDLLHILRHLLDEHGRAEVRIRPLLAVAWAGSRGAGPLQLASTHAALIEALHYSHPDHGYPGDPAAGIAPVPVGRSPLKDVYLIAPSGNQLAAPTLAQYLKLNLGQSAISLEAFREVNRCVQRDLNVRSVGLTALNLHGYAGFERMVNESQYLAMRSLLGSARAQEPLAANVVKSCEQQFRLAIEENQKQWLQKIGTSNCNDRQVIATSVVSHCLGDLADNEAEFSGPLVLRRIDNHLKECVSAIDLHQSHSPVPATASSINKNIRRLFKEEQLNLPALVSVFQRLSELVETLLTERQLILKQAVCDTESHGEAIRLLGSTASKHQVVASLATWTASRLWEEEEKETLSQLSELREFLVERLQSWGEKTQAIATLTVGLRGELDSTTAINPGTQSVSAQEKEARPEYASVAAKLRERLLGMNKGSSVEQAAIQLELELRESMRQSGMIPVDHVSVSEFAVQLPSLLEAASPLLLECGGQQKRFLLVADVEQQKLLEPIVRNAIDGDIAVRIVEGLQPTFVHEGQGIPLSQAVPRLVTALGADHQLVGRLQARADLAL